MNEDGDKIEIDAFTDEGDITRRRTGTASLAIAQMPALYRYRSAHSTSTLRKMMRNAEMALALAALANGDARTAESMLEAAATAPNASPGAFPLRVCTSCFRRLQRDLSPVHRADRARGAYERVIDAWADVMGSGSRVHGVLWLA